MKYRIFFHWDMFRKYPPIDEDVDIESRTIEEVLERIFYQAQEHKGRRVPSATELDIIELEDGRRFRILDNGFNELCSKEGDIGCDICGKFYLERKDVPKAIYMKVRNTFYKGSRNNICGKCFREYGIK